jgi:hypothetical protein
MDQSPPAAGVVDDVRTQIQSRMTSRVGSCRENRNLLITIPRTPPIVFVAKGIEGVLGLWNTDLLKFDSIDSILEIMPELRCEPTMPPMKPGLISLDRDGKYTLFKLPSDTNEPFWEKEKEEELSLGSSPIQGLSHTTGFLDLFPEKLIDISRGQFRWDARLRFVVKSDQLARLGDVC